MKAMALANKEKADKMAALRDSRKKKPGPLSPVARTISAIEEAGGAD
jgi:hypothetical protein